MSQNSFVVVNQGVPASGVDVFYKKKRIGITGKEGNFLMPQAPAGDTIVFKSGEFSANYVIKEARSTTQLVDINPPKGEEAPVDDFFSPNVAVEPLKIPDESIAQVVDEPAEFPGGNNLISDWIHKNLRYPENAKEQGIEGRCFVKFVIETDGSITDIKITRGMPDCPECDRAAIRVIKLMPKWKPAKAKGVAVRSYYDLPVKFKLD